MVAKKTVIATVNLHVCVVTSMDLKNSLVFMSKNCIERRLLKVGFTLMNLSQTLS